MASNKSDFEQLQSYLFNYFSKASTDTYGITGQNYGNISVTIRDNIDNFFNIQNQSWNFLSENISDNGESIGSLVGNAIVTAISPITSSGLTTNSLTRSIDSTVYSINQYIESLSYHSALTIYASLTQYRDEAVDSNIGPIITDSAVWDGTYTVTVTSAAGTTNSTTVYAGNSLATVTYTNATLTSYDSNYVLTYTNTNIRDIGSLAFDNVNPKTQINIVVTLVGGGGGGAAGGGYNYAPTTPGGGGGGGGGELIDTSFYVSSNTAYTIKVGAGGARGIYPVPPGKNSDGTNGKVSTISTSDGTVFITAEYGGYGYFNGTGGTGGTSSSEGSSKGGHGSSGTLDGGNGGTSGNGTAGGNGGVYGSSTQPPFGMNGDSGSGGGGGIASYDGGNGGDGYVIVTIPMASVSKPKNVSP